MRKLFVSLALVLLVVSTAEARNWGKWERRADERAAAITSCVQVKMEIEAELAFVSTVYDPVWKRIAVINHGALVKRGVELGCYKECKQ